MFEKPQSIYIRDNSSNRITFTQLSIYMLMLFPITTLMQIYIDAINRFLFGATFIVLFFSLLSKFNKTILFTGVIVLFELIWTVSHSRFPLYNKNELYYFVFMVILFFFFSYKKEDIDELIIKSKKYLEFIVGLWCFLIAIAMVMPSSYPYGYAYFKPYQLNGFRSGPAALFILALIIVLIVYFKNKKYAFLSAFPMFVLFMGSSRTYFGVGIVLFALLWYIISDKTDKFFLTIIPIVIVGILFYKVSGISSKVNDTLDTQNSYFDFWGTLTSGRSIFWKYQINAFFKTSPIRKLFGSGFNFVYNVGLENGYGALWAHNDFIQLLCSFGYFGTFMYLYTFRYLFKNVLKKDNAKIPLFVFILIIAVWFVNAFFNMFYTYSCSCISYPFICFAVNRYFIEKGDGLFFKKSEDKKSKQKPKSKYIR